MNALTLVNAAGMGVQINAEAEQRKVELYTNSVSTVAVTDDFARDMAVDTLKDLKGFIALVEKSRVDVKGPVIEVGRTIDIRAKEFIATIEAEHKRITKLVTDYTLEQSRKAAQAKAERIATLQRIENERIAAEQAAEAQRQRLLKEEDERKLALQRIESDLLAAKEAENEAERLYIESKQPDVAPWENPDSYEQKMLDAQEVEKEKVASLEDQRKLLLQGILNSHTENKLQLLNSLEKRDAEKRDVERKALLTPVVRSAPAEGLSMRNMPKFEVTDIHALYKARPDLVVIEAYTAMINLKIRDGLRECPGLKIWMEQVASVRGSK